ncbi:hypothetical protein FALCPG4_009656 [Fusarium falciforme]
MLTDNLQLTRPVTKMINPRKLMAPAAAFTMACVLFVYTRSSIHSAREQARHTRLPANGERQSRGERPS